MLMPEVLVQLLCAERVQLRQHAAHVSTLLSLLPRSSLKRLIDALHPLAPSGTAASDHHVDTAGLAIAAMLWQQSAGREASAAPALLVRFRITASLCLFGVLSISTHVLCCDALRIRVATIAQFLAAVTATLSFERMRTFLFCMFSRISTLPYFGLTK